MGLLRIPLSSFSNAGPTTGCPHGDPLWRVRLPGSRFILESGFFMAGTIEAALSEAGNHTVRQIVCSGFSKRRFISIPSGAEKPPMAPLAETTR